MVGQPGLRDNRFGERIDRVRREMTAECVFEAIELLLDGIDHLTVAVADAGENRSTRSIQIAFAGFVDEIGTLCVPNSR